MNKRPMTLRLIVVIAVCVLVFGSVFGMKWYGNQMMNQYLDNMPVPPATISAAPAARMTWDNHLNATGTLVPVNGADLTAEVGGVVTALAFESGQQVTKGTLLAKLDDGVERGELRRLKAQAELARLNLARRQRLFEQQSISRADLDMATSEAEAAQAAAEAAEASVARKNIRAPFDGVLGIRRVNVGEFVNAGTVIVTLQQLDPIDLDFALPERYQSNLRPGLAVEVAVDAWPEQRFAGEVIAVEPRIDETTRSIRLRARLTNGDDKLRAGQFGSVRLLLPGAREVVTIPRTAVDYNSYGDAVFVVRDRQADDGAELEVVQRFVRLGEARGDFVEVVDGLQEGDQVATSGLLKLNSNQPVVINNDVAPEPLLAPRPPLG